MGTTPFIGTEALASGALTRSQLRWNYDALHPDVYLAKGARRDLWTQNRSRVALDAAPRDSGRPGAVGQYAGTSVERAAPVELLAGPSAGARRHHEKRTHRRRTRSAVVAICA